MFFFFKQKTAYEIVSRDWSSDVCSSDLTATDVVEKEHASEVSEMRQRINNPVCKWFECEAGRFEDIRELNYHVSTHIPKLLNLAPIDRVYICQWGGCNVKKSKRKELVQHIKLMHSGKFRHKQWK